MTEFRMPKLGADMTAGTLIAWHKKAGDPVRRGDIVAEVETDKGIIEVEIFCDGRVEQLVVPPGEKVPVGTVLALVREEGAAGVAAKAPPVSEGAAAPASSVGEPVVVSAGPAVPAEPAARLRISPAARELARNRGIDPAGIAGTGPGGAITLADVEQAVSAPVPARAPAPAEDRFARMRRTIAAAMSRSKREIPHYYLSTTIDLEAATTWLAGENEQRPVTERLLLGVLLVKAAALVLREVPELNAVREGDRVVVQERIHVGVAISLRQGGLVAPALHDTDKLSLDELMAKFRDLVNRTRAGSLRASELSDPTITVTSLGERGVETVFPIITPPQVAIVGFGKVVRRPWVVEERIVPRPVVVATLAADHRVSDGHRGGLFLAAVDRRLQEPSQL